MIHPATSTFSVSTELLRATKCPKLYRAERKSVDFSFSSTFFAVDPLADGFNLTDGKVTVDIPCNNEIKSRNTYIVVLMGDSGNKSNNFTIHREIEYCPNLKRKKGSTKSTSNTTTISSNSLHTATTASITNSNTATATTATASPQPAPAQEGESSSDQATDDGSAEEQT